MEKGIYKNSADPASGCRAGYLCILARGWEDGRVPPVLYHTMCNACFETWHGRDCAGQYPCPPQHTVNHTVKLLPKPLPMPAELKQVCFVTTWGFLLFRNKIWSSSVSFSHSSFDPPHKTWLEEHMRIQNRSSEIEPLVSSLLFLPVSVARPWKIQRQENQ